MLQLREQTDFSDTVFCTNTILVEIDSCFFSVWWKLTYFSRVEVQRKHTYRICQKVREGCPALLNVSELDIWMVFESKLKFKSPPPPEASWPRYCQTARLAVALSSPNWAPMSRFHILVIWQTPCWALLSASSNSTTFFKDVKKSVRKSVQNEEPGPLQFIVFYPAVNWEDSPTACDLLLEPHMLLTQGGNMFSRIYYHSVSIYASVVDTRRNAYATPKTSADDNHFECNRYCSISIVERRWAEGVQKMIG